MTRKEDVSPDQYDLDSPSGHHLRESGTASSDTSDSYSLEDDDEYPEGGAHDSLGGNSYDNDSEEDDETECDTRRPTPAWRLLIGMMVNPVEGWKNIRRSKRSVEDVAKDCFYPLTALAASSCFMECFWHRDHTLKMAVVDAINVFVTFFFSNFLVLMLIRWIFPKSAKQIADSDFGKKYVMYLLSTLALFYILYHCFPMIGPVLVFLPLWTIYLSLRGARFFMLPEEKSNLLKTLLCVFIVGAPVLAYWIMDLFL